MKPDDLEYRKIVVAHIKKLQTFGYKGFEFPIAPSFPLDYGKDVESYTNLRDYLDDEGLADVAIATNVGATRSFDPISPYPHQRQEAL